jgi:hypothetical protein
MELSPFPIVYLDRHGLLEMLSSGGIQVSNGKEYALSDVIDTSNMLLGDHHKLFARRVWSKNLGYASTKNRR